MAKLTKSYIQDHMDTDQEAISETTADAVSDEELGQWLINTVLTVAKAQLSSDDEERDEIQVSVNVKVRPEPLRNVAQGGCIKECWEVGWGPLKYTRCKHVGFKGTRPGEG